jgi:hypothetical protein
MATEREPKKKKALKKKSVSVSLSGTGTMKLVVAIVIATLLLVTTQSDAVKNRVMPWCGLALASFLFFASLGAVADNKRFVSGCALSDAEIMQLKSSNSSTYVRLN